MQMLFAVDIDGTIAYRHVPSLLAACNEQFHLGIEPARLQQMSYQTFLCQPELLAYRTRIGAYRFERALGWMDFEPQMLLAMRQHPGACEGVARLATLAPVVYYTARWSPDSVERSQAMAQATYQWLAAEHFPCADAVVFCEGIAGKLSKLAARLEEEGQPIILIDDGYERMIQAYAGLEAHQQRLLHQLTLVAFGASNVSAISDGLRVIAMRSWSQLAQMIEAVIADNERSYL
jgi:hypothetical protein